MLKEEILYQLSDITIIPAVTSNIRSRKECSPECLGLTGRSGFLPIITAPMDSVVGEENYQEFINSGISPVLPRTTPLETRLQKCAEIFCAFGLAEAEEFLNSDPGHSEFYVLIDIANGHMKAQIEVGKKLKSKYGGRIHLMGGNIANPETVLEYAKAGFDYLRVGIGGGQGCITSVQCGVHFPMASLLDEIKTLLKPRCFKIKIVADGGIRTYSDAIKCLALGADYVMMGYTLSKCLESSGDLVNSLGDRVDHKLAKAYFERDKNIFKEYHGMSTKTAQAKILGVDLEKNRHTLKTSEGRTEIVPIEYTLSGWTDNFRSYLTSTMSYTGYRTLGAFIGSPDCRILSTSTGSKLENK